MKYIFLFFLLASSLLSDDYEYHDKRHIQKELSHLKLSHTQQKELKKILKSFRKELKEYREFKEDIEEAKSREFLHNELNIEELNRLSHTLHLKAQKIENTFLKKMHLLLNKKQRKRFVKHFDDWEVE